MAAETQITNLTASAEPFTGSVTWTFNYADTANLEVGIFRADGTLIRRLRPTRLLRTETGVALGAARWSVTWDGRDDWGALVPTGVTHTARFASGLGGVLTQTITSSGAAVGDPTGLAVDTEGNVYVVMRSAGAIVKYSGITGSIIFNRAIPGTGRGELNQPTGIAVDAARNRLFIVDRDPDSALCIRLQAFSTIDGAFLNDSRPGIHTHTDGVSIGGLHFQESGVHRLLYVVQSNWDGGGTNEFGRVQVYNVAAGLNGLAPNAPFASVTSLRRYGGSNVQGGSNVIDVATRRDTTSNVFVAYYLEGGQVSGDIAFRTQTDFMANSTTGTLATNNTNRSHAIAFNPNNNRIYHTNPGEQTVLAKNAATLATVATFAGDATESFGIGWGIEVCPVDSSIWAVSNSSGTLWKLRDLGTSFQVLLRVSAPPGALTRPTDVAVDAQGRIYVVNSGGAEVIVYRPDGTFDTAFGVFGSLPGQFHTPFGIAIDEAGFIFVSDQAAEGGLPAALGNDRIQVFFPRDHPDSPLRFMRVGFANPGTIRGWRGLDFQPNRPTRARRLYAAYGRPQVDGADNRGLAVFIINADSSLTLERNINSPGGTDMYMRDVVSDFEGRVFGITNYLEADGSVNADVVAGKWLVQVESGLHNMNFLARWPITAAGSPNGIAVTPFGDLLIANARDHRNAALGLDQIELYHVTGTTLDTTPTWRRPRFGAPDLSFPAALVYGRGAGVTPEDFIWAVDYGNVVLRRYAIRYDANNPDNTWRDVDLINTTRAAAPADTPVVTMVTIEGPNIRTVGTERFARAGGPCTITITFSKTMDTTVAPWSTPSVILRSVANGQTMVASQVSFRGNVLICTIASLPGSPALGEGRIRIEIANAREFGTPDSKVISPNPTANDTFSFFLDVTPPSSIRVDPPATPTSDAAINVSGNATDNIKLFRIWVYNSPQASGALLIDTVSTSSTAWGTSINPWNVTGLGLGGVPSDNFIYAIAEDAAGNLSTPSDGPTPNFDGERRLVVRQSLASGSGRVTPDPVAGLRIGTNVRFVIRYSAAQALTNDTVTIRIPTGFTGPQTGNATLGGFTRLGDSVGMSGLALHADGVETITARFATMASGGWFEVIYGDSAVSSGGLVFINDGSVGALPVPRLGNTEFQMRLWDDGANPVIVSGEIPPPDLTILLVGDTVTADSADLAVNNTTVFAGQEAIQLLRLTFRNQNIAASAKHARITSVTLRLQDTTGAALNWNRIFSEVSAGADLGVNRAYYGQAITLPASPDLALNLSSNPFDALAGGSPIDLNISGSILPTATSVDSFRVVVLGTTSFAAICAADGSNAPMTVMNRPGFSAFPITTSRVRVVTLAAPDTLFVSRIAAMDRVASEDQDEIVPMLLRFVNPIASRPFFVERLHLRVEGPTGGRAPSGVIQSVRLRDAATQTVHLFHSPVEAVPDSMRFDVPFTLPNPIRVGGVSPETVGIQVVVRIAASVTHNDTFRLVLAGVDTRWIEAFDRPTNAATPVFIETNVRLLDPLDTPLRSGIVTVQRRAEVTQTAIRVTDLANVDLDTIVLGEQFRVHLGLRATAGRAGAMIRSADTDLTFRRANGTIDISPEFTIVSRTHTTLTDLAAGATDTIVYTVVQGTPFSGAGETLVVNNRLAPETMPFIIEKNSEFDAVKLRVHPIEPSLPSTTDTVRIDASHVNVSLNPLANAEFLAGSTGRVALSLRLHDIGAPDTLQAVMVRLRTPQSAAMIARVRVALDVNRTGLFETGTDPWFGAVRDFKTETEVSFFGVRELAGAGDTLNLFVVLDLETAPIIDSTLIALEIPFLGIGFVGQDSIPQDALRPATWFRTQVMATRLNVMPKIQTVSTAAFPEFTVEAVDAWGNRDSVANFAAVGIIAQIHDTWTLVEDRSARWTATTLASQSPAVLGALDTRVTGNLVFGRAILTMRDTQVETVAVSFATGSLPGETVLIGFIAITEVIANAIPAGPLRSIAPDSRNVLVLDFTVAAPAVTARIDSILVRSENANDSNVTRARLWRDLNDNGILDTGTDQNVDTALFDGAGRLFFLTGASESVVKSIGEDDVRFFVTFDIETSPLVDGALIGARIETGGLRLVRIGVDTLLFPTAGEIDSIEPDASNARVLIDATQPGGRMRFLPVGGQTTGSPFTVTIRAEDRFGNLDGIVIGDLLNATAKNVTFSNVNSAFSLLSTSMNVISGGGGATTMTARFVSGSETILIVGSLTGVQRLNAAIGTPPPADTFVDIPFTGVEWARFNYSIPAAVVGPGETAVALAAALRNLQGITDTIARITLENVGTVPWSDLAAVEVWTDSNGNGLFETGVDRFFGVGAFGPGETASLTGTLAMPPGDSRIFFAVVRAAPIFNTATIGHNIRVRIPIAGCSPAISASAAPPAPMVSPESVGIRLRRGWAVSALALLDTTFANDETGAVIGRISFRNTGTATDTITRVAIRDLDGGFRCETDVVAVSLWRDANANGRFDTGVDLHLATTSFSAAETAVFNFSRAVPAHVGETLLVVARIAATVVSQNGDTIRLRYPALQSMTSESGALPPTDLTHTESRSLALRLERLSCTQIAIPNLVVSGESVNILVGNFTIRNHKPTADTLASVTITNDGTHPDTGLGNLRLFLDANRNGLFDAGVDTPFGAAGLFSAGRRTFSGAHRLAASGSAGETIGILALLDMMPGLVMDSTIIRIRIDTGQVTSSDGETAPPTPVSSSYLAGSGLIVVRVVVGAGSDSTLLAAGTAIAGETTTVSVSVRDRRGNMARNRTVRLFTQAGLSILSPNPLVTDTSGFVSFTVIATVAGVYRCTVTIDTTYVAVADAFANFLTPGSLVDNIFSANTQRTTNVGFGIPLHTTAPSFSRTTAGRSAELRLNNDVYSVHRDLLGVPSVLWSRQFGVQPFTLTTPGPAWTSTARVRSVRGAGADNIVFGGYSSDHHFGVNLYYKPWGAPAGDLPIRISPNDSRSGSANLAFETDAQFDQFDLSPTGETVVFAMSGNLLRFHATGATFNPSLDSPTVVMLTTLSDGLGNLTGGYQLPGPWIAYPSWSPDGNRIALTVINRAAGWPTTGAGSDSAAIFVLRNLGGITPGNFPWSNYSTVMNLSSPHLVRVTSEAAIRFAWQPQWSSDGSVLFFSGTTSPNFNYDVFSQTNNPQSAFAAAGVDFQTWMIFYDRAAETTPYAPILLNREPGLNEIIGEMASDGAFLGYTRNAGASFFENRTLTITNQADINANGGVLFDSGRAVVIIRPSDAHGAGFRIATRAPDTSPPGSDSVIISSGTAKRFFRPDTPNAAVHFADSVRIILHYQASHFTETDRIGFDSDGDGIPDRTEAAITAFYWDGTNWIAFPTVRFPAENRIEFRTTHFSTYAAGLSASVRSEFFTGSVHDVVAYPNPWRSDGPTSDLAATDDRFGVKLTNFPDGAVRVRIFTLAGELVADGRLRNPGTANQTASPAITYTGVTNLDGHRLRGTARWDLRNQHGRPVASGVYLIVLEGPGGRATRRVAVIR